MRWGVGGGGLGGGSLVKDSPLFAASPGLLDCNQLCNRSLLLSATCSFAVSSSVKATTWQADVQLPLATAVVGQCKQGSDGGIGS